MVLQQTNLPDEPGRTESFTNHKIKKGKNNQ